MEKKRSPEDILDDIECAPLDDAAERVLAMTAEQRMRELARAGVSERDIEAGVEAVLARMQRRGAGPEVADKMRDEAAKALGAGLYGTCLRLLDEAKQMDPAGDDEPRVQALRATVKDKTAERPQREKP